MAEDKAIQAGEILSEELREKLKSEGVFILRNQDLVLGSRKKKQGKRKVQQIEATRQERRISKSKKKKLDQLIIKKQKGLNREQVMQSIQSNAIDESTHALLKSSGTLGQRETLKQRLKRSILEKRAGIDREMEDKLILMKDFDPQSNFDSFTQTVKENESQEKHCNEDKQYDIVEEKLAIQSGVLDLVELDSEKDKKMMKLAALRARNEAMRQARLSQSISSESQNSVKKSFTSSIHSKWNLSQEEEEQKRLDEARLIAYEALLAEREAKKKSNAQERERISQLKETEREEARRRAEEQRKLSKYYVYVQRKPHIQESRMQLPVCGFEQEIMEAIIENDVVIVCGETGSGKTTQIPQFLYEAGYGSPKSDNPGMVGVTQPRRVAATSMATRVANELGTRIGVQKGDHVAYHIRYDATGLGPNTRIKFMTDGILLREMQNDFLLSKYSAIILDEAHERNLNTDILLGLLSRIVPLRRQLSDEYQVEKRLKAQKGSKSTNEVLGEKENAKQEDEDEEDEDEEDDEVGNSDEYPQYPLKLVIMSATLRVEDFTNPKLFPEPPPIIHVPARQYPVTLHFNRRTPIEDYLQAAYIKLCKMHRKLPSGGILVFLTGKAEIEYMCEKLRKKFNAKRKNKKVADETHRVFLAKHLTTESQDSRMELSDLDHADSETKEICLEKEDKCDNEKPLSDNERHETDMQNGENEERENIDPTFFVLDDEETKEETKTSPPTEPNDQKDEYGANNQEESESSGEEKDAEIPRVHVLPLYSMLPPEEQAKVFQNPPSNHRLIVVATNVAETSLTIPGISYVLDCGREKRRVYDKRTGISKFQVCWISQASADQRTGRAGRTGPGHAYRLYSSAVFNDQMEKFSFPEILRVPIESMVLQLKRMRIRQVENFPFPTPPDIDSLRAALETLSILGAIDKDRGNITLLGESMAEIPVLPRFSKMLLLSRQENCMDYAIATVAGMSVNNPFLRESNFGDKKKSQFQQEELEKVDDENTEYSDSADDQEAEKKREEQLKRSQAIAQWKHVESDALTILRVIGAFSYQKGTKAFCREQFLNYKLMKEIQQLRLQLTEILQNMARLIDINEEELLADEMDVNTKKKHKTKLPRLTPPNLLQERLLCQIVAAGLIDHVARKARPEEVDPAYFSRTRVPYVSAVLSTSEPLYIHPHSAVYSPNVQQLPDYVVYQEVITSSRRYMRGITVIDNSWLANIAKDSPLLWTSTPLDSPAPMYDPLTDSMTCFVNVRYGKQGWELPLHRIPLPQKMDPILSFVRALLDGQVISLFRNLHPILDIKPSTLLKPTKNKKIEAVIETVRKYNIKSLSDLVNKWQSDENFLLRLIEQWIQPQNRHVIVEMWPKIVKQSKKMKAQLESESCTLGKNEAALASKSIRKRVQKQVKIEAQSSKKRKFGQT